MTDQRPIDVSELRDGDIVRAKRGEHGVVEGVFEWNGRNWRIKSDDAVRASIADSWQNGSGVGDWTITDILRPADPEPAPIEVGDWWADEDGLPHVVERCAGLTRWRRWNDANGRYVAAAIREHWTRLDGPPEPPVGSVFVIGSQVWQRTNAGHERVGLMLIDTWAVVKSRHSWDDLATLRILGSVD